ncbi:MAG: DUF4292 domain-containing protein [Syntrophaceae bacterium]|nr:DUF4292 domain-containing protein [Syntrophaceae bacterium]
MAMVRQVDETVPRSARKRAASRFFLAACLAAALAGCANLRITESAYLALSPRAALQSVTDAAVQTPLIVTAKIEIRHFGKRYPSRAALMIQQPDRLRFESLPPLGPPDFFLSIDQGELAVFVPAKNVFYRGRATATNISRFLHLALPPTELVSLLLGQPPEGKGLLRGSQDAGLYRVDREGEGETSDVFWLDPAERRLVRWQRLSEEERSVMTIDFADTAPTGQGIVPRQLTLNAEGVTLAVHYTELVPGREEEAVFALPLPEGITPESLD